MKTIIITKIKFKKDQEKIENILITYGFKQITNDAYIKELSKEDYEELKKELKNINQEDTIMLITICQGCDKNIQQYGNKINLEEEKYVIL
ncbi:MAG: CRISPR-associated endonuclease Cas2 [Methanosphaera sp.]|nr:CRISPR-associated endonuclease Cas2 [Methanosphaera sp.]